MHIRSQNKRELLNCNNFQILQPTKKHPTWVIACITTEKDYFAVAEYSTEEKAQKVMDMLEVQIVGRNDRNSGLYRNPIFHFPSDEELKI